MFIAKIYALVWALVIAAAVVLYVAGALGSTALVIFAFSAAALAGVWLLVVLPSVLHEQVQSGRGSRG